MGISIVHRICGCSDAAVCVQVNVSTAKWSLHLSAPLKQQQIRLPWMRSRLANFYAAGASFSGGTPHSFFCVMSRDILMKGGKVSNLHLHLHNCVHNVCFGWNVLHNSPIPAPTWVPLVARGFPSWSTCRSSKSYLFLDQSKKKKVSSAMQSASVFLAQSSMRTNMIEITTDKLLPCYTIVTGGAMLRTVCLRFLRWCRKEWNWGPLVLFDCPAKRWCFVHLQWLALAFYTSRADQQHFEPFYRNSFRRQDCLFFFFL